MIYHPLIEKVARAFSDQYSIPLDDLLQEGLIEVRAIRKTYDPNRGDFDNYARVCLVNRYRKIVEREWEPMAPEIESTIENIWYKSNRQEQMLSDVYELSEAEKILSREEKHFWDLYKQHGGKRGSLTLIAKNKGRTRAWASDRLQRIAGKLKRACLQQHMPELN